MSNTLREIETRIKHKIDTVENWSTVENTFIPLNGELIVYRGVTANNKETIHFKIGDGITNLKTLPFAYDKELLELAEAISSESGTREEIDIFLQEQINAIHNETVPSNPTAAFGKSVNLGSVVDTSKIFKFTMPNETPVTIATSTEVNNSISNRTFSAVTGFTTNGSHEITPEKTTFTLPADNNTSHYHSAGVGLTVTGSAGTSSGTVSYKANLVSENKASYSSNYSSPALLNKSRFYSVQLDADGKLSVYVPWQNTQDGNDNYYHTPDYNSGLKIGTGVGGIEDLYVPTGNTNTSVAPGDHNHDGRYSLVDHNHDGVYAPINDYIPLSQKGATNGVAELDANGLIPSSQLPSYVDDVLEGYLSGDGTYFYYLNDKSEVKYTGESGKIYVDISTHKSYRYSGNTYIEICASLSISNDDPIENGNASPGSANTVSRSDHIHPSDTSKVSKSGDTMSGTLNFNLGHTTNGDGIKWKKVNGANPFIGYASDQSDGTFALLSIEGTNYKSGLAIGGSSKDLLWKGNKVATTKDIEDHASILGDGSTVGHTKVYPSADCSSYTSDDAGSALTPAAVKKAVFMFIADAINNPGTDGKSNIVNGANTQILIYGGTV